MVVIKFKVFNFSGAPMNSKRASVWFYLAVMYPVIVSCYDQKLDEITFNDLKNIGDFTKFYHKFCRTVLSVFG